MTTQYISSFTSMSLVNTVRNPGIINLPKASLIGGRHINFKDMLGSFKRNTLTLQCSDSDIFEDGTAIKTLKETYGTIELVSNNSIWYIISGTQINMLTANTVTASTINTSYLSTSTASISTLTLLDGTGSRVVLSQRAGFLFINNSIIGNTFQGGFGSTVL